MNIINAVYGDSTGGRWIATLKTGELLARAGHQVTHLIDPCDLHKVPRELPPGVQVVAMKNSGHYDLMASLRAKRMIRKMGTDLIIGHSGRAIWMLKRAAPRHVPVIAFNHSHNVKRTLKADAFFCITPYMQELINKSIGTHKPCFVISNAVAIPPDSLLQAPSSTSTCTVGMLTRLAAGKGVDLALEAMTLLPKDSNIRLVIAGDGEEATALREKAAALGLNERVEFIGWVGPQDKAAFFNGTDIFCYSSSHDVQPLVVLEAMAWGKAVLGNDLAGASSVYENGVTASVIPKQDSQALAAGILDLATDHDKRASLGANARAFAIAHYSEEVIQDALDSAARQLVEAWRSKSPPAASE